MMSIQQELRKRSTYIELKNATNIGEKEKKLEKLGGSLKASIDKLKRLKTDILVESSIKRLGPLLSQYQKENLYYNELQKSLVEIDEQSPLLDKIKAINREFINSHQPEELQKKLQFMKNERSRHINTESSVQMGHINAQQLSGQLLAGNKHQLRRKILEQEQQQINQIDVLVNKIHKIATDTGNMILQQGMKLQIAAATMSRVNTNLNHANKQLGEANQYQMDTNKKLLGFCLITVLIVSVIVLIFYSTSKKKSQ